MRRKALLMVEMLVALVIIAVTAGVFTFSYDFGTVTPKYEAEKIFSALSNLMLKAGKKRSSFKLYVDQNQIRAKWDDEYTDNFSVNKSLYWEYISASKGCSYSWNANNGVINYSHINDRYSQGATITITSRGTKYYVIIATVGSRVRISDVSP